MRNKQRLTCENYAIKLLKKEIFFQHFVVLQVSNSFHYIYICISKLIKDKLFYNVYHHFVKMFQIVCGKFQNFNC